MKLNSRYICHILLFIKIIDNNKLEDIIKLLNHSNEDIKLNIVQLIASMAEHPKGR